jgi:hypothetical protein
VPLWHPTVYPEFNEDGGLARLFYARRFDGSHMLDVTLLEMQDTPEQAVPASKPPLQNLIMPSAVQISPPSLRPTSKIKDTSSTGKAQKPSRAVLAKAAQWQGESKGWTFLNGAEYVYDDEQAGSTTNSVPTQPAPTRTLRQLHRFGEKGELQCLSCNHPVWSACAPQSFTMPSRLLSLNASSSKLSFDKHDEPSFWQWKPLRVRPSAQMSFRLAAVPKLARTPIDLAQATGRNSDDMSLSEVRLRFNICHHLFRPQTILGTVPVVDADPDFTLAHEQCS